MRYLLGIDESGTGAWAGPFCVAGVLLRQGQDLPGVTDSKKLRDRHRRELCGSIKKSSVHWHVAYVFPDEIQARGQSLGWQSAVLAVVREHLAILPELGIVPEALDVVIDGSINRRLRELITKADADVRVRFEAKADAKYPAVSAASILAKTYRNDEMNKLHVSYPEYGFNKNSGYGTEDHADALVCYGRIPHVHRPLVEKNFHTYERKD